MKRLGLFALAAFLAASGLNAQVGEGSPVEIARSIPLESRVLNERRIIDVSLPRNYATSTERYPVLVVLDGEFEHEIAAAIARFYATTSQTPGLIVVGVRNTNRTRDMTTPAVPGFTLPSEASDAGGADRFLEFLETELIPYVTRSYRTAPMRVLAGHSLGGLFALHALAQRPELFTGYIVMEPSTWWNNERELHRARETLARPTGRRARVMMVNAMSIGVDTTQCGGRAPMVRELEVTGETHQSMAASGLLAGLRTMFADYKPSPWRPGTKPIQMLDRYDSLAARIGYEVPIPRSAYSLVVRMSLDSRHFDDAARALDRWESALGQSQESRAFRARLTTERATPQPPDFIPLEIPTRRPTPRDAERFLGRWVQIDDSSAHVIEVRSAGDTIVVRNMIRSRSGPPFDEYVPVIQVTADGTLEWGLPWFRGLAALVVLKGRLLEDGTMSVSREARGWVPREPAGDMSRVARFKRVP